MEDVININDDWYVRAGSSRTDQETRVLKNGECFAIFDRFGDIQTIGIGEQGVFYEGTRHVSHLEMLMNQQRPMLLNSSISEDNVLLAIDLTSWDMYDSGQLYMAKGKIHIFRSKLLWQEQYYEQIRFTNYDAKDLNFEISFTFASDYVDIFEVRGVHREKRGRMKPPEIHGNSICLGYQGLDEVHYYTCFDFDPHPLKITENSVNYALSLRPMKSKDIHLQISCSKHRTGKANKTFSIAYKESLKDNKSLQTKFVDVFSSNEQFNDWVGRSAADLRLLVSDTGQGMYPYAGIPWFCTPFGRDGIISALQCLWVYPEVGRGVLEYLAYHQATELSPQNDAEPGKILHETRKGEMAMLNEIPFAAYYGSVDSTPLFLLLAGRYFKRTADIEFIRRIWPNLLAALNWIEEYGDLDKDGFVEYERKSQRGILQQGWKDSNDSIFHEDGTSVIGPVALSEVQGYVYEAKRHISEIAKLLGEVSLSEQLQKEAVNLKEQFHNQFWLEDLQTYALALDGGKRPCRVRSSNAGHALFTNIANKDMAKPLIETLLSSKSFSGWGVRTIAAGEARYNPMSYHNGSVWPHDNAIIAMGMAQYGFKKEATEILTGMFNAALSVDHHRLPELFCGFHKRQGQTPTLYPVACSPQAWASGAVFMMLQASLGLSFAAGKPEICFNRPFLPDYINSIRLENLKAGDGEVDLLILRDFKEAGVHVIRKSGDVEVAVLM